MAGGQLDGQLSRHIMKHLKHPRMRCKSKEIKIVTEGVMKKITKMFDNQEHCDITFNIQGHLLGAHKLVLIAQEFQLLNERKDDAVIQVKDIDYEIFHSVIRYLYVEHIDINKRNIFKMMHAAQVLHETRLADLCSSYLMQRACADNFVYLLNASVYFNNTTLQKQLSKFFAVNMKSIIHNINFKYLSPEGIMLLMEVPAFLSGMDHLKLFVMLWRWARAECERQNERIATGQDIRNAFGKHFRKLRVPYMHLDDIGRLVIGKDILTKEEELSLLHFLILPTNLRSNVVPEDVPFDIEPLHSKNLSKPEDSRASHMILHGGNCSLCKAEFDGYYGAERIHCSECDFDICMRCFSIPQHKYDKYHRRFCCVKTVYGKPEDCCSSCGWPVKPWLFFHKCDSKIDTKRRVLASGTTSEEELESDTSSGNELESGPKSGKHSNNSAIGSVGSFTFSGPVVVAAKQFSPVFRAASNPSLSPLGATSNLSFPTFGAPLNSTSLREKEKAKRSQTDTKSNLSVSGASTFGKLYLEEIGLRSSGAPAGFKFMSLGSVGSDNEKSVNSELGSGFRLGDHKDPVAKNDSEEGNIHLFGEAEHDEGATKSAIFDFDSSRVKRKAAPDESDESHLCKNCKRPLKKEEKEPEKSTEHLMNQMKAICVKL